MEQERELEPIEQTVRSFEQQALESPELAREAFWRLLDIVKECQKTIKTSLLLVIVFGLTFELLDRGLVSEASLGGIRLTKLDSFKFLMPIAIGFEVFRAMSAIRDRNIISSAYSRLSAAAYPKLHESRVDVLLDSKAGLITSIFPYPYIPNRTGRLSSYLSTFESVIELMLLFIGLPAYTLVQLFRHSGFAALQVWVSAGLTSMFVIIGLVIFFFMNGEGADE